MVHPGVSPQPGTSLHIPGKGKGWSRRPGGFRGNSSHGKTKGWSLVLASGSAFTSHWLPFYKWREGVWCVPCFPLAISAHWVFFLAPWFAYLLTGLLLVSSVRGSKSSNLVSIINCCVPGLKAIHAQRRHLINRCWMNMWINGFLPLLTSNYLDVFVPRLAWHIPYLYPKLRSAVSSPWNLPASFLPGERSTLFIGSRQELCTCECVHAGLPFLCVCARAFWIWFCNTSIHLFRYQYLITFTGL